jgi:hypothetical protein
MNNGKKELEEKVKKSGMGEEAKRVEMENREGNHLLFDGIIGWIKIGCINQS